MIRLRLPNFEGPLDLLLYLIRKNELDIKKISLAQITREYLEYLTLLQDLDLNIAGEYVVMAATLIKIKVRSILPGPASTELDEEAEEDAEILIQKLKEYEKFKRLALYLREKERRSVRCYPRGITREPKVQVYGLSDISIERVNEILLDILNRTKAKPVYSLKFTQFDIKKRMADVLQKIVERSSLFFYELIEKETVEEIVITFIAILELVKAQKVRVKQKENFGKIKLYDITAEMAVS
jgi:segregation and condensation protein A